MPTAVSLALHLIPALGTGYASSPEVGSAEWLSRKQAAAQKIKVGMSKFFCGCPAFLTGHGGALGENREAAIEELMPLRLAKDLWSGCGGLVGAAGAGSLPSSPAADALCYVFLKACFLLEISEFSLLFQNSELSETGMCLHKHLGSVNLGPH